MGLVKNGGPFFCVKLLKRQRTLRKKRTTEMRLYRIMCLFPTLNLSNFVTTKLVWS